MTDTQRAKKTLAEDGITLALCKGETVYTDTRRGVVPLLALLDTGVDLTGFSAADKVVGKAAAFLYLRLGVATVYADVMSSPAYDLLIAHGVSAYADTFVPAIRTRTGDGFCPMETVCLPLADPTEAERAIRHRLAALIAAAP